MTARQFWDGDPRLAVSYREAERIRQEREYAAEWRAGRYALEALLAASPAFHEWTKGRSHDYPDGPLFETEERRREREERRERERMERMLAWFGARASALNAGMAGRGEGQ